MTQMGRKTLMLLINFTNNQIFMRIYFVFPVSFIRGGMIQFVFVFPVSFIRRGENIYFVCVSLFI